jgi:hypothetical protein
MPPVNNTNTLRRKSDILFSFIGHFCMWTCYVLQQFATQSNSMVINMGKLQQLRVVVSVIRQPIELITIITNQH